MSDPAENRDVRGNTIKPHSVEAESVNTKPQEITFSVPTDFDSVDEALHGIRRILPRSNKSRVEIRIESGHAINTPIYCENDSWRHFRVTADDATVLVADTFPNDEPVIEIRNAVSPVIDTPIDAQGNGDHGMYVRSNSTGHNTWGIQNAGETGLLVANTSLMNAYQSDWSGAASHGIRASRSAHLTLGGLDGTVADNAGGHGLYVHRASTVRATDFQANDCGMSGVYVRASGALAAQNLVVQNATDSGVEVIRGGRLDARDASVTGSFGAPAVVVSGGSNAYLRGSTIDSDSPDNYALSVRYGSKADLHNATATAPNFSYDLLVRNGSILNASALTTSSSTAGDPHEDDLYNMSFNTVTGQGIAFAETFETSQ